MNAPTPVKRPRKSHIFERQAEGHYAEPKWVSERLFDELDLPKMSLVLDPSCGFGRIPHAACRAGLVGFGRDIVPRWDQNPDGDTPGFGRQFAVEDWFTHWGDDRVEPDAIVSNPPYDKAQAFAELALLRSRRVCFLLPTRWVQGDRRSRWLETTPLEMIMPITPRPSMPPGHVWLSGGPTGGGTVDFSWFIWRRGHRDPPVVLHLRREP